MATTTTTSSSSSNDNRNSPPPIDIPGHYWDPERKRYFRITRDHPCPFPAPSSSSFKKTFTNKNNKNNKNKSKKNYQLLKNINHGSSSSSSPSSSSSTTLYRPHRTHWKLPLTSFHETNLSISQLISSRTLSSDQFQQHPHFAQCLYTRLLQSRQRSCAQYPYSFGNQVPLLAIDPLSQSLYWTTDRELYSLPIEHLGSMHNHPPQRIYEVASTPSSLHISSNQDIIMTTLGDALTPGSFSINTQRLLFPRRSCWSSATEHTTAVVGCTKRVTVLDTTTLRPIRHTSTLSDPLAVFARFPVCYVGYRDGTSALLDTRASRGCVGTWPALAAHVSVNLFACVAHRVLVQTRNSSVGWLDPVAPRTVQVYRALGGSGLDVVGMATSFDTDAVVVVGPAAPWTHLRDQQVVYADTKPPVNRLVFSEVAGWVGVHAQGFVHVGLGEEKRVRDVSG